MQQWLRLSVSSSRKCESFSLFLRVRCRWHFLLLRDLLMCHDVMRAYDSSQEMNSFPLFHLTLVDCIVSAATGHSVSDTEKMTRQKQKENKKTEAEKFVSTLLCSSKVSARHSLKHTHIQYAYRSNLKLNRTWLVCPSPYPRLHVFCHLFFVLRSWATHEHKRRGHLRCPIQTRAPKWFLNFVFVIDFECYFLEGPPSSRPYFVPKIESACIVHVRRLLPSPSVHFVCTSLHCVKPIPTSVWFPISVRRRRKLLRFVAGMHRRIHLHLVFVSIARALRMTFASGNMRRCFAGKTVRRCGRRKKW